MIDRSIPNWENQLWHARKILREQGRNALDNPHGMIGRECECGDCFTCAAALTVRMYDRYKAGLDRKPSWLDIDSD
ncbi:MAG: hypothetical protein KGJ90_00070 [Patescibacteria group bacterium]|nr:hypothetical protein [Patescibacteria group bacterium]